MGARFTRSTPTTFAFPRFPRSSIGAPPPSSVIISGGFALLGAFGGVRRVMALPPAEALRPESPARFRPLLLERLGIAHLISPSARMVLRNLERRPLRTAAAVTGVALAVALLASGRFPYDAFDRLMAVEFGMAQRYDAVVSFVHERAVDRRT